MSFTADLLRGLGAYLAAASIGVAYKPAGVYLATDTGVVFGLYPTSPDRCIAMTAYATSDEAKVALSRIRVELAFRGVPNDSLDVDDLADSVFNVLHGYEDLTFGSAHVDQALRVISHATGVDDSKRSQRSDSYDLDVDVPVTAGRPW